MAMDRFCRNCGAELSANAKFCSECGTRVEKVPLTKPIVDLICESCGSSLEVSPDDQMIAICPHCGHNHMVPMNRSVKIQQIKSDTHKVIELAKQKTVRLVSAREQANKEKENETSFLKWLVESLLARSGTVIGLLFCLLAFLFENIRALLLFGLILLFVDIIAFKFKKPNR